jgi:hypothetical protein
MDMSGYHAAQDSPNVHCLRDANRTKPAKQIGCLIKLVSTIAKNLASRSAPGLGLRNFIPTRSARARRCGDPGAMLLFIALLLVAHQ